MPVKQHGLKTEILMTLTILLGAALVLGGLFMLNVLANSLLDQRVKNVEYAAALVVKDYSRDSGQDLSELLIPLKIRFGCEHWRLYDKKLSLVEFDKSAEGGSQTSTFQYLQQVNFSGASRTKVVFPRLLSLFWSKNVFMVMVLPVYEKEQPFGVIELEFSLADIRAKVVQLLKVMFIYILLYGGVLSGAGFWLLKRNIINPARLLLHALQHARQGRFNVLVPVAGPHEIVELSAAFNKMITSLQASRAETERYVRSLESANKEIKQTRDELIHSEKLASVGQLAAGVAHEIGNPLAAVIGYLEVLKLRLSLEEQDLVQRCLNETSRIDTLVREMLDFSRPNGDPGQGTVFLHTELHYCVDLLTHQGTFNNIEVDVSGIKPVPGILGGRDKIRQVFVNLLLNAGQACSGDGNIWIRCGASSVSVWCGIEDDGCGIPQGAGDRIFDPFFTTKPPGQGTGLGLAVCRRIISDTKGHIEVRNPGLRGAEFLVTFPRLNAKDA